MDPRPEPLVLPPGHISRAYFSASIEEFLELPSGQIIGRLTDASEFSVDLTQRDAWNDQVRLLKDSLGTFRARGHLFFEFVVPRVGKRIDVVVVVDHVVFVSSQAQRLKPHAIDVKTPMDPVNWFLNPPDDVRSSFYLEDVATEFHVQGLELDWACVVWDGDFRYAADGWRHHSLVGNGWQNIKQADRKTYLKNAYRVLLTRARQGMVIAVPHGDPEDPTRKAEFYDGTFGYLKGLGLPVI